MARRNKRSKFENTITFISSIIVIFLFISLLFFKSQLSSLNIEVEKIKKSITKQEKVNESLTMKVNELVSLENMQLVANNAGLEYNNNNIIVIQK